ncbi:MAG: AraC family transcriptional regulator ligand-binding domain-containing protein [Pseudomonadota bacterium]
MAGPAANHMVSTQPEPLVERSGTVRCDPVMAVARFAVDSGLGRDRVENLIGVSFDDVSPDLTLPAAVGPDLFRLLLTEGTSDLPALEIAQSAPFSFFGGLERAILLAPTGQEALRSMAENFAVFHDSLETTFEESSNFTYFSFRAPVEERDNGCCNEVVLGVLMRLMRSVFGQYAKPHEVRIRYDRNGRRSTYENFFAAPLLTRSSDESHGLVFRRADMRWRQPGYDRQVFELSEARLAKLALDRRRITSNGDYHELTNASNLCVGKGLFGVASVAAKAGLSERKAQRVAQSHGTTVGKLIEHARLRLLREQLWRDAGANADDLSRLVGFSDSRSLRRAVKAWTGKSLREIRTQPFGPS